MRFVSAQAPWFSVSIFTTETQRSHRGPQSRTEMMKNLRRHIKTMSGLAVIAVAILPSVAFSQTKPESKPDLNKYALIINGASGEPAYGKQFDQWTTSLRSALQGRFGFAKDRVKLLTEKPADSSAAPATAEESPTR